MLRRLLKFRFFKKSFFHCPQFTNDDVTTWDYRFSSYSGGDSYPLKLAFNRLRYLRVTFEKRLVDLELKGELYEDAILSLKYKNRLVIINNLIKAIEIENERVYDREIS